MFLRIDVTDEWTTTAHEDGFLHERGDTSLHTLRIRELPNDVDQWMAAAALAGAPDDAVWNERGRAKVTTVDGWSAIVREISIDHAEFSRVRVVAFFQFLEYGSGAIIDVHASTYDAQRAELVALLQQARPEWGPQELACLANLFGGAARRLLTVK